MEGPWLTLLCGIPGSGKSTLARELEGYRISTDELRETLLQDASIVKHDVLVFSVARSATRYFLKKGLPVIIDATSLRRDSRAQFIRIAQKYGARVRLSLVDCPLDLALERNAGRERKVPEDVLRALYRSYQPPSLEEGINVIEVRGPDLEIREVVKSEVSVAGTTG